MRNDIWRLTFWWTLLPYWKDSKILNETQKNFEIYVKSLFCTSKMYFRKVDRFSYSSYRIVLTLSTFSLVFADVSTYGTFHCCARVCASVAGTCLLFSRSILFPTNKKGIFSSFFTRKICSLKNRNYFSTFMRFNFIVCNITNVFNWYNIMVYHQLHNIILFYYHIWKIFFF